MFKKFIFALAIISSFVFSTSKIRADNNYAIDSTVSFKVDDSGNTLVSHSFTLENLTSDLYATTYTLTLQDIAANNVSAVDDKGNAIPFQVQNNGTSLDIKLTFADAVAGRGQTRHFTISYENSSLAVKTGDVWEVSIPRLSDNEDFRNYQVDLFVPDSFGQEAYIIGLKAKAGGGIDIPPEVVAQIEAALVDAVRSDALSIDSEDEGEE